VLLHVLIILFGKPYSFSFWHILIVNVDSHAYIAPSEKRIFGFFSFAFYFPY
jgi:hypothetical protein